MARISAALIAVLALAACSTPARSPDRVATYEAGSGIVEAVQPAAAPLPGPTRPVEAGGVYGDPLSTYSQPAFSYQASPSYSDDRLNSESAAGASLPPAPRLRVTVRMADGSRQTVVTERTDLHVGQGVQVTSDGRVAPF